MDYRFTNEFPDSKINEIVDYLRGPRLWVAEADYPDYFDWLEKVYVQLKSSEKRAIICLEMHTVIGAIIYQKHEKLADTLEIKNLTVRPNDQGRHIASFLMKNVEREGLLDYPNITRIQTDTKVSNLATHTFLDRNGYQTLGQRTLYFASAEEDLIFVKNLKQKKLKVSNFHSL